MAFLVSFFEISRSRIYYKTVPVNETDLRLMKPTDGIGSKPLTLMPIARKKVKCHKMLDINGVLLIL